MSDFELTQGQGQAMKMVEQLMKTRGPAIAILTGYAGTGKTTMIKAVSGQFGAPTILCPTGKAALRVTQATGLEAKTIHRWLYKPFEDEKTGEVRFIKKDSSLIERPENGLLVIDEASMVGRDLWEDVWDLAQVLELRVLIIGDPFQLAPVEVRTDDSQEPFAPLVNIEGPRTHLTEITRQALDNPILRASMILRETGKLDQALSLLNRVFSKKFDEKCLDVYRNGGAVIVHKNATRHQINAMMRPKLGRTPGGLDVGEPLLVLRNTYDLDVYNGEVIPFQGWEAYENNQIAVKDNWKNTARMMSFGLGRAKDALVMLSPEQIVGDAQDIGESVVGKTSRRYYGDYYADPNKPLYVDGAYKGPPHLHANFGYALTCHKFQGSETDIGLIYIENSIRPTSYEGRRWVYTAITRCKRECYFTMEV